MSPRRGGIPSWSIRRPIGTIMLASVAIVLGLYFLSRLPIDLLPSIVYPQVRASVNNPGVAPEVMEETIAKPLENALATTEDLERIETEIEEGRVGINLLFRYGADMDFALQDASKNLDRARSGLPEEADPPSIFKFDPGQIPIYEVGFSSEGRDLVALRDWVDTQLRPRLLTISGVASVDVSGGLEREIHVVLDQERLRSYGLTISGVIAALRAGNQDVAAGLVASPDREVIGKTAGKFRNVREIRELPLEVGGGRRIPLSEVAEVRDTHPEQRLWARLDGVPAVKLSVRKQPDANTVAVAEGVSERLDQLAASGFVPPDVAFEVIQDQADFIGRSLESVRNAALMGGFLAMLVVLIFLGSLRKTFVIGTAIPLAILATFVMMGAGDLTLNIMSLGGLALGVGLLIDNSIVMLENIFRRREEDGLESDDAAHEGAAEVKNAVIAATATNLAAVVPFLLISGLAALLFRELILTITFAIVASLAVALTVVPTLAALLGKVERTSGLSRTPPLKAFNATVQRMRRGYLRVGAVAVRRRGWAVLTAVGLLGVAWWLTRGLGNEFLPQVDSGNVGIYLRLPPGSSAEETNRVALEVEELVRGMPDVEHMFTVAGGFLFGGSTSARSGRGSMDIVLSPSSERSMSADAWVQQLQEQIDARGFPGARIFVRPPRIRGLRSGGDDDVSISIQGDDLAELGRIAEEVQSRIEGVPGLENAQLSAEEASPLLTVRLDRERAGAMGLDVAAVGQTLRTALGGTIATRYTESNREYDVRVMLPRERFTSPEDLGSVALFPGAPDGGPVYLRDVATVSSGLGPTSILREQQNRSLRVEADVLTEVASVGAVSDSIEARLVGLEVPDGYGILMGGEAEAIRESNRQLMVVILLAIFLVFVVLAVQYESLVNPLVILVAIPLSLVGVGFALWITGTPQSAPVLLGVILLAGIVVNNAILLVEYADQNRAEGASIEEAVIRAGSVRLRPIMMTTLTTMFGMLPLAIGLGEGSELMQPLAIAVVGGLLFSSFLTLFVVPGAYVTFNAAGERLRAWLVKPRDAELPAKSPVRDTIVLILALLACMAVPAPLFAQSDAGPPPPRDPRIEAMVAAVSAERIEGDIRTLAGFGTRHTLSDTLSEVRGIGAARRWIHAELERISGECGGCLEVFYQRVLIEGERRIPNPTWIVSVVAVLRGTTDPDRYVIMTGDIDSRVSDVMNATSDSPGANDNASGMAGVLEAARTITGSGHAFAASIAFAGLAGEEQGLFGGARMAEVAATGGWRIEAVLNNDMIGNTQGQNGIVDDGSARVFSESPAATTTLEELRRMRYFGGEVDGPSRQLARYVDRIAGEYIRNLDVRLVYRLDRFGRGGHHRPFNDAGFPAVRIMETNEDYRRQHQDVRVEDGVEYGDVVEEVEFDYAAKLTALNVATLGALAFAPAPPDSVRIGGAVEPAARLAWSPVEDPGLAGYKVYWRATDSPTWDRWEWVGTATGATMEGLVVDNWFFGVAAVDRHGNESPVVFPTPGS